MVSSRILITYSKDVGHNNTNLCLIPIPETLYIYGLVLERRNSSALALELRLSCTNPLIYSLASFGQEFCFAACCCSLQKKIWNLSDRSIILPKFIYDKEGKLARPTQILTVRVRGPALILKTVVGLYFNSVNCITQCCLYIVWIIACCI